MGGFLKKFFALFALFSFIFAAFFSYQPKTAEAGVLETLTSPACDLYAATLGRLKDQAEAKARKAAKGAAQSAAQNLARNVSIPKVGKLSAVISTLSDNAVPASDATTHENIETHITNDRKTDCQNFLRKIILSELKKRLLDKIVTDTINWIQGGGKPKFVTDLGGFLGDAAQAAAGDVIQEIGLGELCEPFRDKLRITLETTFINPTPFQQKVRCTLNQVVSNFKDFYQDFSKGGWVGFTELLKPQNNYYGALITSFEEVNARIAFAQNNALAEVTAGQGFLNTTKCLEWEARGKDDAGNPVSKSFPYNYQGFVQPYPDPDNGPKNVLVTGINDIQWVCSKKITTTPGKTVADTITRALNIHSDAIIGAEEISDYISALVDAGVSRLFKAGAEGLLGIITPSDSDLQKNIESAGRAYAGSFADKTQGGAASSTLQNLQKEINDALSKLALASTTVASGIAANNNAVSTSTALVDWCNQTITVGASSTTNGAEHPASCNEAQQLLDDSQSNINFLNTLPDQIESIEKELKRLAATLKTYLATPPNNETLANFVTEVGQFTDLAESIATQAEMLAEAGQTNALRASQILAACTDNDETTACP